MNQFRTKRTSVGMQFFEKISPCVEIPLEAIITFRIFFRREKLHRSGVGFSEGVRGLSSIQDTPWKPSRTITRHTIVPRGLRGLPPQFVPHYAERHASGCNFFQSGLAFKLNRIRLHIQFFPLIFRDNGIPIMVRKHEV